MNSFTKILAAKIGDLVAFFYKYAGKCVEGALKLLALVGSTWACSEGLVIIINAFSA